jgi:DNA-binding NtrC family response regulator
VASPPSSDDRPTASVGTRLAYVRRFELEVTAGPDQGKRFRSAGEHVVIGTHESADLRLEDRTVSRFHCEISVVEGRLRLRDLGSRNGTTVDGVSVTLAGVGDLATIALGSTRLRVRTGTEHVSIELAQRERFGGLVGRADATRALFRVLEIAARSDATVLLEGDTGTGKECAAEAIHAEGRRARKPFVVVDCGALPETLVESELFGHEAGSFTGATTTRVGAFEAAAGGTLFLDEIGELPIAVQPKLLRAIESRAVRRVGSDRVRKLDVRIIAATLRSLRKDVNTHRFRGDLYFRLAVLPIRLPPLRDRREDLPLLVEHFLEVLAATARPGAARLRAPAFLAELERRDWPGNVRELRNYLERCLAGPELAAADAPDPVGPTSTPGPATYRIARDRWERAYLADLLERHADNVSAVARAADVDRAQLYRMLWRLGLRSSGEER